MLIAPRKPILRLRLGKSHSINAVKQPENRMKKSVKIIGATVISLGIIGATAAYAGKSRHGDHAEHAE